MMQDFFKLKFSNRYTQLFTAIIISLIFMSLVRVFFFLKYQYIFLDLSLYELFISFIYGIRVDIITLFTFVGVIILLLSLPFRFVFNRYYKTFLSILWSLIFISILAICIGDILYFEFSQRHISNEILGLANDMNIIIDMAFGSLFFYTIASFVLFAFIFYIFLRFLKHL